MNQTTLQTRPQHDQVAALQPRPAWTYRPNVDIFEAEEAYRVIVDLPGVAREQVEVTFEDGVLTIQASAAPRWTEGATLLRQEYGVGGFHRRFQVDAPIDATSITAACRDGVLTVELPKAPEAKPRRIEVG